MTCPKSLSRAQDWNRAPPNSARVPWAPVPTRGAREGHTQENSLLVGGPSAQGPVTGHEAQVHPREGEQDRVVQASAGPGPGPHGDWGTRESTAPWPPRGPSEGKSSENQKPRGSAFKDTFQITVLMDGPHAPQGPWEKAGGARAGAAAQEASC